MSAAAVGRLPAKAILALAPLLLSACGGLFPAPPERQLYRLEPAFVFPATLPHSGVQLGIATPTATAGLDTRRIALAKSPVSLDYFADAEWVDSAPLLVRTTLIDGFEASGGVAAVEPAALGLSVDCVLETTIRDFEAVYADTTRPPRVRVALDLKLVGLPQRKIVASTIVRGEAAAAENSVPAIVTAFNTALGGAVEQAVEWSLATPTLSDRSEALRSRAPFVPSDGARKP
jgi:cholesterol transport system auxiliary component